MPAPEDTDQVKVTSYSFSAQYGFSTGNVISLTTKAGTHDYHFVADEYIRNPDLDANLYFNNLAACPSLTTIAISSDLPAADRCISRASTNSGTKPSFSPTMRDCGSMEACTYSAEVPTTAQLGGDFSSELTTTSLGADCLGRPIYQGAIYNPYSLVTCPDGSVVRNPYPGNIIPTTG